MRTISSLKSPFRIQIYQVTLQEKFLWDENFEHSATLNQDTSMLIQRPGKSHMGKNGLRTVDFSLDEFSSGFEVYVIIDKALGSRLFPNAVDVYSCSIETSQ